MAAAGPMTETIRIWIEPEKKAALSELYKARGTTISQATREFLDKQLDDLADPLDRFDKIATPVDAKLNAYGAPEPTIEDVVKYVETIRAHRAEDAAGGTEKHSQVFI